ncbi:MAG: glycosyltransferase family 2 protein [Armatimonadota bacterium]|nr:glycosyltransferase family 2 protein [Armatimonadota bacterium]MDW8104644.1 glycosyltransferase family 2 protein [Armatimonadota bacterium]MDW8291192.1 glycosyltransferase family 2 protein [Armatimonadota bacterium]
MGQQNALPCSEADCPSLSVVVPAYNEEGRLADTLPAMYSYLKEHYFPFELLVVDDGSTDHTPAIVQQFAQQHPEVRLISYQPNRGKGHAVRTGVLQAQGEWVLFSDADLATPIEELTRLAEKLREGYDIAIASRAAMGAQLVVRQPWYRELAGRSFNLMVQLLAVPGIHDTQCGFKLFRQQAAREIFSRCEENGFSFDIEVLHVAQRLGYRIAEVPVRWMHREGSKVRLLRDAVRMFLALLRITRRHQALRAVAREPRQVP